MRAQLPRMIPLTGIVCLTVVQCGFSADILSTTSSDGDTSTEPARASETDVASNVGSDELNGTSTESDTPGAESSGSDRGTCSLGEIHPSEVLLIGDSWIAIPGTRVGELARAAGAIEFDEDFVYRAVVGATIEDIVQQYDSYLASVDTEVKVVIINGGAVDIYGAFGSGESISYVADAFSSFLVQLAVEGAVQHVIYVLYGEGTAIPGVAELRVPMEAACVESAVPCHFLDLQSQSQWGEHSEYMSIENINPSPTGSDVIAAAIWQEMQNNCIAP